MRDVLALRGLILAAGVLLLAGCAQPGAPAGSIVASAGDAVAERDAAWVVLPFEDASNDANAGRRAEVLVQGGLRARGVQRVERAASGERYRYAVGGTVQAWNAAHRPDDQGYVALDLTITDLATGTMLFKRHGKRHVRARQGPSATAQRLIDELLAVAPIGRSRARSPVAPERMGLPSASGAGYVPGPARAARVAMAVKAPHASQAPAAAPLSSAAADAFEGRSTTFFYADELPIALLAQFDRVVLEPDNIDAQELIAVARDGAATFAYLSIGEVGSERLWRDRIQSDWVLGRNEVWNSEVMDLANAGWASFVLERVDALMAAGYDGLFLDTMDSFTLHASGATAMERQADGLADLLQRIATRHPGIRLIANRGFEVLERVAPHLEAIAAESLYANWNNATGRYGTVSEGDRAWLLAQLERARDTFELDVIAIDYVAPSRRDEARAVASRIAAHGFVPWVATPALDHVGVGAIDVLPREVLLPFDSRVNGQQEDAEVHRLLATPLEYLGYVPVYHDIASKGVPERNLGGRYAGIALWARGPQFDRDMGDWLESQMRDGVRVALLGTQWLAPGSDIAALAGVEVGPAIVADRAQVRIQDALTGFERPLPPRLEALGAQLRNRTAENTVHLSLEDDAEGIADLVVTGPWGGVAAAPAVIDLELDDVAYWILDPYAFLERALGLARAPMPDVTSERGQRLWMAHIDGDALPSWAEVPGRHLGAEVIRDRILDRWPLPHTISVVEAELTRVAAYADRRERMVDVMRGIFARPNVEIASHTFSHPFQWEPLAQEPTSGRMNLPVGDYRYSPEREVAGSAAWIDEQLAPRGKRTKVMLWSGDALPDGEALSSARTAGLANLNGGVTTITRARPALTLVTPNARTVGNEVQVYAPIMNENVYTDDWRGPFDGFRRVIETFELTERPRRLKPLSIYYHFYSGTKAASIRSLEEVYAWSVEQDIKPVTISDYSERVQSFRRAGVARRLDGGWRLSGLGGLGSVRLLGRGVALNRSRSRHVEGAWQRHDGLYLAVGPARAVAIALEPALLAAEVTDAIDD